MPLRSLWITGPTLSGKTNRLIEQFCQWGQEIESPLNEIVSIVGPDNPTSPRDVEHDRHNQIGDFQNTSPKILILAANAENRINLMDRISEATSEQYPYHSTTPLGFFEDEVTLFWPLLIQSLDLRAQFPLRLRPETEQELAARVWRPHIEKGLLQQPGVSLERMIRRTLDLFQLAAFSCMPREKIAMILQEGFEQADSGDLYTTMVELLQQWRDWCLQRGLLTYGIITELYWRYLLPISTYQQHLIHRYPFVLADDVDEYPAITYQLFDFLLDNGATGAFTYNPDGGIRLGLGADPEYLSELQDRCQIETLDRPLSIAQEIGEPIIELVLDSYSLNSATYQLPNFLQSIPTRSRAALLRETAEAIVKDINLGIVKPEEVAIIAPGLDAIARYSLISILNHAGIAVESLKDQRPLISYPMIRALLSILTLVYPGLGRLVDRDAVAEMLVVLSQRSIVKISKQASQPEKLQQTNDIDSVRAGLLADNCFSPDIIHPCLLPIQTFPRWDRVGYRATQIYQQILAWIEEQRSQQQQRQLPNPIFLLDRAIQKFFMSSGLSYDQLAALRELMETATHYWEVQHRLQQNPQIQKTTATADEVGEEDSTSTTVGKFIQFLQRGVVSANPFPVRSMGHSTQAITLATIFQYRASRRHHRWQFWLDVASPLWLSGGSATLYGAPLFLQSQLGNFWTIEDSQKSDQERLRRILLDLLSRVSCSESLANRSNEHRIYLCHSELAVNGQEQTGPLLSLVYSSVANNN
ncbi:MAG: recombinase family protein [Microcoleaceae cyanobacterium]